MLGHAFERLGCRRVELKTDAVNERSRGAMEASGAVRGRPPQAHARARRREPRLGLVQRRRRRVAGRPGEPATRGSAAASGSSSRRNDRTSSTASGSSRGRRSAGLRGSSGSGRAPAAATRPPPARTRAARTGRPRRRAQASARARGRARRGGRPPAPRRPSSSTNASVDHQPRERLGPRHVAHEERDAAAQVLGEREVVSEGS